MFCDNLFRIGGLVYFTDPIVRSGGGNDLEPNCTDRRVPDVRKVL